MSSDSVSFLGGGILVVVMVKSSQIWTISIDRDLGTQFLASYFLIFISSGDAS